jgi:hypothetical protein
MRLSLAIAALLALLAVAEPATATTRISAPPASASDTGRQPAVPGDRSVEGWTCTPTGCSGAPASSSGSALLGFAVTTLAAAGISRRRPPATA